MDADAEDLVSEMAEVKTAIEDFGANVTDPDLDAKIQFPAMKSVVTVNIHGKKNVKHLNSVLMFLSYFRWTLFRVEGHFGRGNPRVHP